jgi:hypothetical protein
VLPYASPTVRTAPPRTFLRMWLAFAGWVIGRLLACVRIALVALGYATLGAGVVLHRCLAIIAALLFFLGGMRWDAIKARTLRAAQWVDARTLATIQFLRRCIPASLRGPVVQ